jgi:predicted transposase/invertase (TIGR01784 family)
MISKYLDPKNDYAFKKIFGEEKHKRIPIAFLNAVFNLKGKNRIIDLEFLNPIQPPEVAARKESIVDLLVRNQGGTKYIVEMQVSKVEGFEKRAQFYAAKTYCSHFKAGKAYNNLKKVVFLAITSYVMFPKKSGYKSDHVILDNKTYQNDLKDFSFTFVELPKFNKLPSELETIEEKWYYFLKHADESNEVKELVENPEIKEAYEVIEKVNWSEKDFMEYERVAMAMADAKGAITAAKKEGKKIGIEEGLQKGLQKGEKIGLQKGKQIGVEEGARKALCKVAKKLSQQGLKSKQISDITGLTVKEIKDCLQ